MSDRRKLELPDRRQHTYADLEERLDNHLETIENRLRGFFTRALAAFAIIGLVSAISLLGFGIVLENEAQISKDIQAERFETIFNACVEQNIRHDRAIRQAERLLPLESARNVELLVDEIQPYEEDCTAYTNDRVGDIE